MAEAERIGTGIALLQRIVPPEVDREPPKYVVPKHHQIAKTIWIIGAIALPTLLLAVASDDFATTIIVELGLLFGMLLILPMAVGLSHLYDRFLLPEKLQAEAAHEAWQKVRREWQEQRPKIARMGARTRSRYISNRVVCETARQQHLGLSSAVLLGYRLRGRDRYFPSVPDGQSHDGSRGGEAGRPTPAR